MKTIKIFLLALSLFVLGTVFVNATTIGDDIVITVITNGACSDPDVHYSCASGTSTNNVSGSTAWTWSCAGANGGTTASCSESKPPMTGTLTATASSCVIANGASSCNVNLNWSIANPVATPTSITASGMTNINVTSTLTTPQSGTRSVVVPYSSRTFYLYNNGVLLAQTTVTSTYASCANGANNPPTCTTFNPCANGANNPPTCNTFPACANGATNPPACNVFPPCANGANNPPTCTTFTPCANGANNPPTCTTFTPCANGATNPPTCTTFNPTGTLTGSNCTIALGNSTCNTTLTLSVSNPVGGATTNITKPTNVQVASGLTPASKPNIVVARPSTTFYLNHNGATLANRTITATCASGTTWNGSICAVTPCANGATNPPTCDTFPPCANGATNPPTCTTFPPCANGATNPPACDSFTMAGNINATDCTIASGNSSCSSTLSWSTQNPVGTSAVTTPTNITIRTANSGSGVSYTVSNGPGSRNFYLYNNGILLDQDGATASCASGTTWNGSTCAVVLTPIDGGWSSGVCTECDVTGHQQCTRVCDNPAPANGGEDCPGGTDYTQLCTFGGGENGLLNIEFTSTPTKIFKGRSATLTWTSNADICVGDANFSTGAGNPANGSAVVTPTATTNYKITCTGGATENKEATVKVSSITVIET